MDYVMPCMRPDFSQTLDAERPHTLLTKDPQHAGTLEYRYDDTGETACVPNVWYNQTVATRAAAMRFDAQRDTERADRFEKYPPYDMSADAAAQVVRRYRERAAKIESEAQRLLAAGDAARPVLAARLPIDYSVEAG